MLREGLLTNNEVPNENIRPEILDYKRSTKK